MTSAEKPTEEVSQQVGELFDSLEIAKAIDTHEFRLFLDHVPIAIVISKFVGGDQRVVFANKTFESLTGHALADVCGKRWSVLSSFTLETDPQTTFPEALPDSADFIGTFRRDEPKTLLVEAFAGVIENDDGTENYRIVALIDVTARELAQRDDFARQLRDKDMLLKEIQHRVKNNLQLITALIRLDARNQANIDRGTLDRLAGRIESLHLLYREIAPDGPDQTIDLGHYLGQIAGAVTHAYATDGIRLDLKADHTPISINVAMPVGLLMNEILTNSFKYAFAGRGTGTLTIRCLRERADYYRIVVADDGHGLPEGTTWPVKGKLGSLMLDSLRENAAMDYAVESAPGQGVRVHMGLHVKQPAPKKPN